MATVRRYFKDFYGGSACIQTHRDGRATLSVSNSYGTNTHRKKHASYRAARLAMGRLSDCWREVE